MIEPKELRIGNFVSRVNGDSYQATVATISDLENGHLIVNPIPITKEWLNDFGFMEDEDKGFIPDEDRHCTVLSFKNIDFAFIEGNCYLWLEVESDTWYNMKWTKIKYVHQLQNLFFALTGQELKPINK